jgi:hypothetical protein
LLRHATGSAALTGYPNHSPFSDLHHVCNFGIY